MKKLLFLLIAFCFAVSGFAQPVVTEERVKKWADYYPVLISKDRSKIIQQINMEGAALRKLLENAQNLKFISGANPETDTVTVFLQLVKNEKKIYYNIYDVFNSARIPGNKPPLCPPPNGCDVTFKKNTLAEGLTEKDINDMYKGYNELVKIYPLKAIQQITMDPVILKQLLFKIDGLKLIPAVDLADASTNLILQFNKNGEFTYSEIGETVSSAARGTRPLCPPPVGCGL